MQLNIKIRAFGETQELIAWDKIMVLRLKHHLMRPMYSIKGEKLFAFGGLTIGQFGKNGIYQDKLLRMVLFIKITHI